MRAWGERGAEPGEFDFPIAIAVSEQDELFVTDHLNSRVQKFDTNGELLGHFADLPKAGGNCFLRGLGDEQGTGPGQFFAPHGVAVDSAGRLHVVDASNHRIQKFEVDR